MLSHKLRALAIMLAANSADPEKSRRTVAVAVGILNDLSEDAAAMENTPIAVDIPTAARDVPVGQSWVFSDHRTLAEVDNVVVFPGRWPQPPCDGGAA